MTTLSKKRSKIFTAVLLVMAMATSSFAELRSVQFTPEEKANDGWKAYLGMGGGNVLLARDGSIFATLRIGIDWNSLISTGLWASMILDHVRNYNVKNTQMIDYKTFGVQAEVTPFRKDKFSISFPLNIGGGVVNALNKGDEAIKPTDYFFMEDLSAQFNYRVTKALEISIGGGYRMFQGIEENNLKNSDFNTPFGELRFTIKE